MAQRGNHYEAAVEAYVRSARVACVAIDEARRPLLATGGVKNPDFLFYPGRGPNLVVEVKGKRGRGRDGRRAWENWVTIDDLDGLSAWQRLFGPGFQAVIAFAYAELSPEFGLPPGEGGFAFRGRVYRFWAIAHDEYLEHLRSRGPAWRAVAMARREFRGRVRPLAEWLRLTPERVVPASPWGVRRRKIG